MKNRRTFIQQSAFAGLGLILANNGFASNFLSKYNSNIYGVQIGVITYSFRSLPGSAEELLSYCKEAGVSAIELMGDPAEAFAGSPVGLMDMKNISSREQFMKLMEGRNEKARAWRETASTDKFIALRKMFNKEGISIYAYKPDQALTPNSTDPEINFAMRAAKALGATSVTLELPEDLAHAKRLGELAAKNKIYVGYHAHTQATDSLWDAALSMSPYNSINLDCGHYIAAGGANTKESLLAFINKHHSRITSMHIKDRQNAVHGGKNMPWGQGDTPLKEVLQLLKEKKYTIPATIELEYEIPAGSNAVEETKKCIAFAKAALQ